MKYVIASFGLSQRRASRLLNLSRNMLRYKRKPDKDEKLRARMKELADQRKRFGCRRLHKLLKREKLVAKKSCKYECAGERNWLLRHG